MVDWLIGSHPALPMCTFDVTVGVTTESYSIATGRYYLYRDGGSFDLLDAFQDALNSHSLLADAEVFIDNNRLVHADSDTTSFAVTFTGGTTSTAARNMMGFTGNLADAQTHTAGSTSAFLWSPGKPGSPDAQLGTQGNTVKDTVIGSPGTGFVRAVQRRSFRKNKWEWGNVDAARVHTAAEAAGEYYAFWENVTSQARRFYIYTGIDESGVGSDAADLSGDSFGPYQWVPSGSGPMMFEAPRELKFVHVRNRIELPVHQVPEYT